MVLGPLAAKICWELLYLLTYTAHLGQLGSIAACLRQGAVSKEATDLQLTGECRIK